jgi:hypothetical protein
MSTAEWARPAGHGVRSRKPLRPRAAARPATSEPALADFLSVEVQAIDAEKWPVVPLLWWQPELPIAAPRTSGLRNERQHKIPAFGFLNVDVVPVLPAAAIATPETAGTAGPPVAIPRSDLMPLGWDPRTALAKGRE